MCRARRQAQPSTVTSSARICSNSRVDSHQRPHPPLPLSLSWVRPQNAIFAFVAGSEFVAGGVPMDGDDGVTREKSDVWPLDVREEKRIDANEIRFLFLRLLTGLDDRRERAREDLRRGIGESHLHKYIYALGRTFLFFPQMRFSSLTSHGCMEGSAHGRDGRARESIAVNCFNCGILRI